MLNTSAISTAEARFVNQARPSTEPRKLRRVCIFGGRGVCTDPTYREMAVKLGKLLAEAGVGLVYGGGTEGLMGTLARSFYDAGGAVTAEERRDALALRDRPNLGHEIPLAVEDDVVGAGLARGPGLLRAADRGDDAGAEMLGPGAEQAPDAARGGVDQHRAVVVALGELERAGPYRVVVQGRHARCRSFARVW